MALKYIMDSGHGWLEVPLADYPDALESGTGYGRLTEDHAYLEEDLEMADFLERHPEIQYASLERVHVDGDWPGRDFACIPRNMTLETYHERRLARQAS